MRLLLFTHEQDIDGLGCAVLADNSNIEYKLVLCKTFELDEKIKKQLNNEDISYYDKIIVTDLCPKSDTLNMINNDKLLHEKFQILDHHKTAEEFNRYDFVKVVFENDTFKESGTSLFYQYLKNNNLIEENDILNEFVELTRQYDTWDWYKTKNFLARKLHIIFETQGINYYLKTINRIISNNNKIMLNDEEENIVKTFEQKLLEEVKTKLVLMKVKTLKIKQEMFRVGYIKILYKYRNDVENVIKNNNENNIDVVGMIIEDKDSVSYRSIKSVDVSTIAECFGGSGHKSASSHPKDNLKFQKILRSMK